MNKMILIEEALAAPQPDGPDHEDGSDQDGFKGPRPWNGFDQPAQPEPWYRPSAELAAIYGEMCAINETPRKEQTEVQTARLNVLRAECVAIHEKRLATPPQRQPLTEPEYLEALGYLRDQMTCSAGTLRRVVRALESAIGDKT